jgi:hypothetical protein
MNKADKTRVTRDKKMEMRVRFPLDGGSIAPNGTLIKLFVT